MVVVASSALPPDGDMSGIATRHSLEACPFWHFVKVGSPGRPVAAVCGPSRMLPLARCAQD
jgi:hypothetical protein